MDLDDSPDRPSQTKSWARRSHPQHFTQGDQDYPTDGLYGLSHDFARWMDYPYIRGMRIGMNNVLKLLAENVSVFEVVKNFQI